MSKNIRLYWKDGFGNWNPYRDETEGLLLSATEARRKIKTLLKQGALAVRSYEVSADGVETLKGTTDG